MSLSVLPLVRPNSTGDNGSTLGINKTSQNEGLVTLAKSQLSAVTSAK